MSGGVAGGQHSLSFKQCVLLGACVLGIWGSYLAQGVLQEDLSTKKFGPDQTRFEHLTFLNLAQNVVCFVWASVMLLVWRNAPESQPPLWTYWSPGVTNSVGPALGLVALRYISYPAQVLAKSSKMIPVMLMGAVIYRVHYTIPEYVCTFLVAGGVSVFALFKSSSKAIKKLASPNAPLGYLLCFLNLGMDGFTNATQDSITKKYPGTSTFFMMMSMNFWGALYTSLYMFAWPGGGGFEAIAFCQKHPEAFHDILWFCLCGAIGQNFIFLTMANSGALVNTTITTTRKFMSILVSAVWNNSPLTTEQWTGVMMVFAGLAYQIYLKRRKMKDRQKKGELLLGEKSASSNGAAPNGDSRKGVNGVKVE